MTNVAAMTAVRDLLRTHPDVHNQRFWACGTAGCFAGWAIAYSQGLRPGDTIDAPVSAIESPSGAVMERAGRFILGLTEDEADALFLDTNDLLCDGETPEQEALRLADALIARDIGALTDDLDLRQVLVAYGLDDTPAATR